MAKSRRKAGPKPIHEGVAHEKKIVEYIDDLDFFRKHKSQISKLYEGKVDVPGFLKELSPQAVMALAKLAFTSTNEKVRLNAVQDWLDRAGFSKVEKHAFANLDPNTPKEQLISMLGGLGKKTKTIEIIEDDDTNKEK